MERRAAQPSVVHAPSLVRGAFRRAIAAFSLRRRAALSSDRFVLPPARSSRRLKGQPLRPSRGQTLAVRRQRVPRGGTLLPPGGAPPPPECVAV